VTPIAPAEGCLRLLKVRHFPVVVAPDAVAHIDSELGDAALSMMQRNMHAEIVPAEKCLG
jgi:hypothetical protein